MLLQREGSHERGFSSVFVFDAMPGGGVVFHDLAGSASALGINLEEDGVSGFGDSYAVEAEDVLEGCGVNDCLEEVCEVAVGGWTY